MKFLLLSVISASLSSEVKDSALTVYNTNMASVNQTYLEECRRGISNITISNMPKTIISDSINLNLPDYLELRLQSYKNENSDYVKQSVSIFTKDNSIITGTLYKFDGENYIIKNDKEEYLLVSKDYVKYLSYGKFDEIDFRNRMINNGVLKLELNSTKSDKCKIGVNYLLNNISWTASYDAFVNENETELDINGRVVLTNDSGYNFKNAKISLVAGSINRVSEQTNAIAFRAMSKSLSDADYEGGGEIKAQVLSDFYAYDLPFKEITINTGETLSLDMFSKKGVKFKKIYVYKGQKDMWYFYDNLRNYKYDNNLTAQFIFENNKENSMEIPLPEGRVRIYKKKGDFLSLIGEDNVKHTAPNSKVEINTGKAFNVSGERKIIKHDKIMPNVYRDTIEIKIKNEKNENINVKIKEYLWGNWKMIESSHKYDKIDVNNIEFNLEVAKKSSVIIKYTAEYNFNQ